jgi:hypothetical protein
VTLSRLIVIIIIYLFRRAILTARPEECGVAGLVAVWLALVLSMVAGGQGFVALLAAQTGAVPVLPQGRLSLGCGHNNKGTKYISDLGSTSLFHLRNYATNFS